MRAYPENGQPGLRTDWIVRQIECAYSGHRPSEAVERADSSGDARGGMYLVDIERHL